MQYLCPFLFQLILEAPDDIMSFKFCPTDPNIICGGCINGQIVLWDISQHAERLKQPRGGKRKDNLSTLVCSFLPIIFALNMAVEILFDF